MLKCDRLHAPAEENDGPLTATPPESRPTAAPDVDRVQRIVSELCGDRYALHSLLGHGQKSGWERYRATDTYLGRDVVVRVAQATGPADLEALRARVRRVQLLGRANDHLVCRAYDAVVQPAGGGDVPVDTGLIVTNFVDGPTLQDLLDDGAPIDRAATIASLQERVRALTSADVSLGDVQPAQVVMSEDGPALVGMPQGTVGEAGPTSLAAILRALGDEPGTAADATSDYDGLLADDGRLLAGPDSDDPDGGAVATNEPRRNKIVLLIAALLALVAVVVVGWFGGELIGSVTHESKNPPPAAASSSAKPSASSANPAASGQPIAIQGATLLDPPPGDGQENQDRIKFSYDGNVGTTWPTLQYKGSPVFGNLKKGVGIVYDLGSAKTVSAVKIDTTLPGAVVQIRTATSAGTTLDAFAQAGGDTTLESESAIQLPPNTNAQYVLVWFTKLVPQGSYYQASLSEVTILS